MAFQMPKIRLGDTVLFYQAAARHLTPCVAIVTSVGSECLGLNVIDPNLHDFRLVDGVRHMDDPRMTNPAIRELGAFETREEYFRRVDAEAAKAEAQRQREQQARREPAAAAK